MSENNCLACYKISSMISFENSGTHTCKELEDQISFRFMKSNMSMSEPEIIWEHESELSKNHKDLLMAQTIRQIQELPKELQEKLYLKILEKGKL